MGDSLAMSNQSVAAGVGLAGVVAHCGGSPVGAVELLVGAIASAPAAPEPYAALAELWQDRRSDGLKESLEESGSLSAVLAQAYFLFLEGDMDNAVMALGSVTGVRPDVAWCRTLVRRCAVSRCGECRGAGRGVSADAGLRPRPDSDAMRERFAPWFHASLTWCPNGTRCRNRWPPWPGCPGLRPVSELSFALCDRADAVDPVM